MDDTLQKEPSVWVQDSGLVGDTNNRLAVAQALSPNNHQLIDMFSDFFLTKNNPQVVLKNIIWIQS